MIMSCRILFCSFSYFVYLLFYFQVFLSSYFYFSFYIYIYFFFLSIVFLFIGLKAHVFGLKTRPRSAQDDAHRSRPKGPGRNRPSCHTRGRPKHAGLLAWPASSPLAVRCAQASRLLSSPARSKCQLAWLASFLPRDAAHANLLLSFPSRLRGEMANLLLHFSASAARRGPRRPKPAFFHSFPACRRPKPAILFSFQVCFLFMPAWRLPSRGNCCLFPRQSQIGRAHV